MTIPEVDRYLASVPAEAREALEELRATIRALIPDSEEALSYQVPTFKWKGKGVVAYAAMKDHCSLFTLSKQVQSEFQDRLSGFKTSKGTIRFTPEAPIPSGIVADIVRDRIAEIEANLHAKRAKK